MTNCSILKFIFKSTAYEILFVVLIHDSAIMSKLKQKWFVILEKLFIISFSREKVKYVWTCCIYKLRATPLDGLDDNAALEFILRNKGWLTDEFRGCNLPSVTLVAHSACTLFSRTMESLSAPADVLAFSYSAIIFIIIIFHDTLVNKTDYIQFSIILLFFL